MDEYIKREDALKIIDNYSKAVTEEGKVVVDAIRDIIAVITPTADVAQMAEVAGYRKQEWIRVDERLPSVSGYVLVYTTAKNYMALPYSKKYKLFNARDDNTEAEAKGLSIRVSCWMPIPEPPKT